MRFKVLTAGAMAMMSAAAKYKQVKKVQAPDFRESEEQLAEFAKERASHGITEPEPSPHYWVVAESPDHQRAIIFETQDGKVLNLRIGLKPQVMSSEDYM
jgi:hypothetical protein